MVDPNSPTFGLPSCLRVPIAAADVDAIEIFVGNVEKMVRSRKNVVQALLVRPFVVGEPVAPEALLWRDANREEAAGRLFPKLQVWVHVDYARYRQAYIRFGMPAIPLGDMLDHIQNREAIRIRWYSHPYLRLCPVSRQVNTSAGHSTGTEGMEKDNARLALQSKKEELRLRRLAESFRIIYADPIDLTKMLNIPTGTKELPGVAETLKLFYPEQAK